jgi:carboxymethylenebutenolidase
MMRALATRARLVTACVLLALTAACKKKETPKPEPAKGRAAPAASAPAPAAPAKTPSAAALTGGLSEEVFKALHVMKEGKAPAPKGQRIDLAGGKAYLSLPQGAKAPLPAVIVIHEWWGLNANIEHWSDRLAADGYAALAVDLYGGKVATTPDAAMQAMKAVDPKAAEAMLLAAHRFLAADPRILAKRRASIGWCFGGRQSLNLALAAPDLDAAVIYYGVPETDPARLKAIKAHVLAIFGSRDKMIPPAKVDAFEAGLKAAGVTHRVLRYDADHAFANPSQKVYDTRAADAAYQEVRAFLAARLKSQ